MQYGTTPLLDLLLQLGVAFFQLGGAFAHAPLQLVMGVAEDPLRRAAFDMAEQGVAVVVVPRQVSQLGGQRQPGDRSAPTSRSRPPATLAPRRCAPS